MQLSPLRAVLPSLSTVPAARTQGSWAVHLRGGLERPRLLGLAVCLVLPLGPLAGCGGGSEGGSESSGATVEYYDPETRLLKKAEGVKQYGREEGIWTWYHENGVKQREQAFVAGLRTGPMTAWYDTGAVMARGSFEGDEENGLFETFHPNGTVESRTQYVQGSVVGKVERFYEDGDLRGVTPFEGGRPEGQEVLYHPGGAVYWSKEFREGKAEGPTHARHPNGALLFVGQFRGGLRVGTWHYWFADGSYQGAEVFDPEGNPTGEWIKYGPQGQALLSRNHLEDGGILAQEWTADGRRRSWGRVAVRPSDGAWLSDGPFFVWGPDGTLDAAASGVFADFERQGDLLEEHRQRAELLIAEPAQPGPRPSDAPRAENFDPGE